MSTRVDRRAALEVAAGVALAFLVASLWDLVAVQIWGHRGTDRPLMISLALSLLIQAACAAVLWKFRRRMAYGFAGYIACEILFMFAALTVFHRS